MTKPHSLPLVRCRFPEYSPSSIATLSLSPPTFDTATLLAGGSAYERGILAVGKSNGDVELFVWGGHQGWSSWRTLPSSFPLPSYTNSKKPTSLLSHLLFTHQTTLSDSDLELYDHDLPGAQRELLRLSQQGCRLFGVGGVGSELVEWEWGGPGAGKEVGRVKSTLPTLPPIFSLAASKTSSHLAIGCEDSTIRILNIMDDELELIGRIELGGPGKIRALSLAWGMPREATTSTTESSSSSLPSHFSTPSSPYLIAGCSNSSIIRFDSPSSSVTGAKNSSGSIWKPLHRMTLDRLKGEHTVVWTVTVLSDGTIVSGDSMGNVKFWDGEMGTQSQSFQGHKVDVLCLAVGSDGTSVFTSGIDQKTIEYRLVDIASSSRSLPTLAAGSKRWIQSSGRRLHSHDVRAMVVSPPYFPAFLSSASTATPTSKSVAAQHAQVPILTSAGLDLSLILVSVASAQYLSAHPQQQLPSTSKHHHLSPSSTQTRRRNPISETDSIEFETTVHRRCAYVPQRARPLVLASEGRLLVVRRERSIGVWKIDQVGRTKGGRGQGRSRGGIDWSQQNAKMITRDEGDEDMEITKDEEEEGREGWRKVLEMDLKLQTNLIASAISNDGKWLAVSDLYETKLFRLTLKNDELVPRRQKTFSTTLSSALPTSLGTGSASLAFTPDSKKLILATSFGGTIAIVEMSSESSAKTEDTFRVVKVFGEHAAKHKGERETRGRNGKTNGTSNGDVEMNGVHSDSEDDEDAEEGVAKEAQANTSTTTIACLSISSDGKWLASADLERRVCVFDLESLKHHTTLPTSSHVPCALSFLPSSDSVDPTLIIALPTNALSLFSLSTRRFVPWSLPLSQAGANGMMDIREPILGIDFEPRLSASVEGPGTAVVWGANWLSKVNFSALQQSHATATTATTSSTKRSHSSDKSAAVVPPLELRTTRRYQPLVLFGFLAHPTTGATEAVVVEKTWFDLAKALPEAWIKSGSFGT